MILFLMKCRNFIAVFCALDSQKDVAQIDGPESEIVAITIAGMAAYAEKLGENKEEWAVAGLLHDADYEAFPDKHPSVIVDKLRSVGEEEHISFIIEVLRKNREELGI